MEPGVGPLTLLRGWLCPAGISLTSVSPANGVVRPRLERIAAVGNVVGKNSGPAANPGDTTGC